jgi:hypothetical protein
MSVCLLAYGTGKRIAPLFAANSEPGSPVNELPLFLSGRCGNANGGSPKDNIKARSSLMSVCWHTVPVNELPLHFAANGGNR